MGHNAFRMLYQKVKSLPPHFQLNLKVYVFFSFLFIPAKKINISVDSRAIF